MLVVMAMSDEDLHYPYVFPANNKVLFGYIPHANGISEDAMKVFKIVALFESSIGSSELEDERVKQLACALLETIQDCETFLRKIAKRTDVNKAYSRVLKQGMRRGDYR